ncbi:hypothetical protein P280DRAFT_471172 [Massarina eburnea CBS 473.64]|uniref:VASt domain-containing protein n=1 Tax=Massarina eburnea CBS 473.64 TaxID=1395130 RepID=A0A6A6RV16_9PLEO|nr:hypothetical protein P280DRAFT_471172 [Massarina eburnea CBS 473.64]
MATTANRARSTTSSAAASPKSREQSLAPTTTKGGVNSSTASIASSNDASEGGGHEVHGDGTQDRQRSRASDDAPSEGSTQRRRRMSTLFKGRRKSSARRKSLASDTSQPDLTAAKVPPMPDMPDVPGMPDIRLNGEDGQVHGQSEESLGLHKSVPSSLLTEDSDAESAPARPAISPHPSHSGYLTLSSPLIASESVDSAAPSDATLVDSATSDDVPTLRASQTFDVTANKRGPSPVGRLKEAFAPRRTTAPKPAGDSGEVVRPATSGGLGTLFGGKKRENKLLDGDIQASPPQLHTGKETRSTSALPAFAPQRIITQFPETPPNINAAPTTFVTPPTPTDAWALLPAGSAPNSKDQNFVVSPSGNMISHRRARSSTNPPSKLSNSVLAPLTPTLEEVKTPGGTAGPPPSPGFFSSVFSAAQNAASTLSTSIGNKGVGPQKADETNTGDAGGEEVIGPDTATTNDTEGSEKRPLAVETLGSGNLSLAQLGIAESEDTTPMSSNPNLPMGSDEASAKAADLAAAQAVSAAYATEKPGLAADAAHDRTRSLTTSSAGAMSPPRVQEITDSPAASSIHRQGSIRSRISGGGRRRHRGSSAATGNTVAAAIGVSASALVPQAGRLNGTGFAVAPPKRNRDFHTLFKSVPEDDYLIEDYSAALQKEILLQGRLYVSEGHLCFSSNILGWVTNLVISFDEVVSVEKKSTAVVFPNAIVIQTLHARNVFASLLTRDATYDLIIGIWKISHPNLKSSLNGVALDGSGTGDKTEKAESVGSEDGSIQDSDDDVYDEDAEDDDGIGSFTDAGEGSVTGSEMGSVSGEVRKLSATVAQAVSGGAQKLSEGAEASINGTAAVQDYPGGATHAPTECGDNDQHYDKLLIDTTIPAPLGKIFSLTFGPGSGTFMRKWLVDDQKSLDLQLEDDGKGLGEATKTFSFSYIKPLGGSIGPKQTKCNITSTLEQYDLNKAVSVSQSTQTPDVPSGNIFLTKTRYCLMWGPNNTTRLIMTYTVEWSGKSWLRGPIEKGAGDGQMLYATALTTALRNTVATKSSVPRGPGKPGKGKKRSKANMGATDAEAPAPTTATPAAKENSWGPLDPLRSLLGPVADIIDTVVTKQNVIVFLFCILLYNFFFSRGSTSIASAGGYRMSSAQRQIAYEEIWRNEEAELWKWLEERVALDRVQTSAGAGAGGRVPHRADFQQKIVTDDMRDRQMDEAIRTTEEKLKALKHAVRRERETGTTKSPKEEST